MLQRNATSFCTNGRAKVSCRALLQCVCLLLVLGVIVEIFVLHLVLFYVYSSSREVLQTFDGAKGSFIDKLLNIGIAREAVVKGKYGGISWLIQNTVDRLYVVRVQPEGDIQNIHTKSKLKDPQAELYVFGFDVSHSGEALYIYSRILRSPKFPYARLIVDIGANDGLMASNSYNFIHWGWSAILVEPQHSQLELAKKSTERYELM